MNAIPVTNNAFQKQTVILPDQSSFVITMKYFPQQFGWFITNLSYNNFQINGLRICVSGNFLHQFKNQIPFGLACLTTDNSEPLLQDDFQSGKATLYLLSQAEVTEYADILNGKIPT